MTRLRDDAGGGLPEKEVSAAVREVNSLAHTDPDAAFRVIEEMRANLGTQIEEHRAGLRVSTPKSKQIAMHLGWVIKQPPADLRDTNPYTTDRTRRYLEEAVEVLREALARYGA